MGMQEKYVDGTIVVSEKAENHQIYLVKSGTVALYINYNKPDEYLLGLCNKGNVFGEMGALCHAPSMYTAVVVSDAEIVAFSEFELGSFLRNYPDSALGIMRSIARMNTVLRLNLNMLIEDSKEEAKIHDQMIEEMKEILRTDDKVGKWHFLRGDTKQ